MTSRIKTNVFFDFTDFQGGVPAEGVSPPSDDDDDGHNKGGKGGNPQSDSELVGAMPKFGLGT